MPPAPGMTFGLIYPNYASPQYGTQMFGTAPSPGYSLENVLIPGAAHQYRTASQAAHTPLDLRWVAEMPINASALCGVSFGAGDPELADGRFQYFSSSGNIIVGDPRTGSSDFAPLVMRDNATAVAWEGIKEWNRLPTPRDAQAMADAGKINLYHFMKDLAGFERGIDRWTYRFRQNDSPLPAGEMGFDFVVTGHAYHPDINIDRDVAFVPREVGGERIKGIEVRVTKAHDAAYFMKLHEGALKQSGQPNVGFVALKPWDWRHAAEWGFPCEVTITDSMNSQAFRDQKSFGHDLVIRCMEYHKVRPSRA